MLKIHCCPEASQRKLLSGLVEVTASSTVCVIVPFTIRTRLKAATTPEFPTEFPFASQTRNLAGTVLPCLNVLVPFALTGCRIAWPKSPRQAFTEYCALTTAVCVAVV